MDYENFSFQTLSGPVDITGFAEDRDHLERQLVRGNDLRSDRIGRVILRLEGYQNARPVFQYTIAGSNGQLLADGTFEILPTVTADQFAELGAALFGSQWKSDLADGIGMSAKTVARFSNGTQAVMPHTRDKLLDLAIRRRNALNLKIDELENTK